MYLPPLSRPNLSKTRYDPDTSFTHIRGLSEDCRKDRENDPHRLTASPHQRFWQNRGRHSRFSSQIDPKYHYKDFGLSSLPRKQTTLDRRLRHYQQLRVQYDSILTDRKQKSQLLKEVKSRYSVRFSRKEIAGSSSAQLALAVLTIVNEKQKNEAATKIAKAWRIRQWRRARRLLHLRKRVMARRIQVAWKAHVQRKKAAAVESRRQRAALSVQTHWRGYSVRKATKELLREQRMHKTFLYFDNIRSKLLAESGRTIWRYWRRYQAVKRLREYKEWKKQMEMREKAEETMEVGSRKSSDARCAEAIVQCPPPSSNEQKKQTVRRDRFPTAVAKAPKSPPPVSKSTHLRRSKES